MANDDFNSNLPTGHQPVSNHLKVDQTQTACQHFEAVFLELFSDESSSGRLLLVFIKRTLRVFHLNGAYNEAYIVNEVYIRGRDRIQAGEVIRNPPAWMRQTAYNLIRELKRDQQKSSPFEDCMAEVIQSPVPIAELEDDLATLRVSFQLLDPKDQKILNLWAKGLPFEEIRTTLRLDGKGDYDPATLRKRKERALSRLRRQFHAIKTSSEQSR
jgi:DNA-directed RNA polymerase specialized sigma24 family protein